MTCSALFVTSLRFARIRSSYDFIARLRSCFISSNSLRSDSNFGSVSSKVDVESAGGGAATSATSGEPTSSALVAFCRKMKRFECRRQDVDKIMICAKIEIWNRNLKKLLSQLGNASRKYLRAARFYNNYLAASNQLLEKGRKRATCDVTSQTHNFSKNINYYLVKITAGSHIQLGFHSGYQNFFLA